MINSIKYTAPILLGSFVVLGYRNMISVANNIRDETRYGARFHCELSDINRIRVHDIYKKKLDEIMRKKQ